MAQIVEYQMIAGNPAAPLGLVESAGLALTNVTTSGTAANTNLDGRTRYIEVRATDKNINIDVGVTADANSLLLSAGTSQGFALPPGRSGTWRVSIIDD